MKSFKNIPALIFSVIVIANMSCSEDFLDQKPTSAIYESNYYRNLDELETGLVACYSRVYWSDMTVHWMYGNIGSDDADCGSEYTDIPDLYNISYSRLNSSNGMVEGGWYNFYHIIARCNQVIDKSVQTKGDSIDIKRIVDQAKFLRALSYYQLVTVFGDIPLVNRFLYPSELNLTRAPAAEIWAQIESDLKDATNLPTKNEWNADGDQSGRVTSGAAWALLGKVYLTQKKYLEANSAFYKVVDSKNYSLVPDYGFLYRHEGENNDESVFEVQFKNDIPSGGNMGTWGVAWRLPRDPGQGWGFDTPTQDLLDEYEEGDPRVIYTFMFKGDRFPMGNDIYTVENNASPTGYNSRKIWVPWEERENLNFWEWDYNYRYMRYAEVLLLYAESLNRVNKRDSARMLVNMVRKRARETQTTDPDRISCAYPLPHPANLLPDITVDNQSELEKAIWHEQRVELAMEGHRRNMLMRMGQFKERMETAKAYAGVTVDPHELLFPIPAIEIELSNYVLTQNPGY